MSRMLLALPVLKEGYIVEVYGPPQVAGGGKRMRKDKRRGSMAEWGPRAVGDESWFFVVVLRLDMDGGRGEGNLGVDLRSKKSERERDLLVCKLV